jgi:hypothetical protein
MSRFFTLTIAINIAVLICTAQTPVMTIERSRVLSQYGETESLQLSMPINKGIGTVSSQILKRSGASALRLHFVVETPAPNSGWVIQVSDKKDKKLWAYGVSSPQEVDIWSDELVGDTAKIEVLCVADLTGLKLTLDHIVVSKNPTVIKSLTVNKLMPISSQPSFIRDWGKSIARVVFVSDTNGRQYLCTGFLLSADLFITNNHCISSDREMRSGLAEFDYDSPGAVPTTFHFKELLKTDHDLDFTLLRLSASPGRQPLTLDVTPPVEGKALIVIQHPAGRPKEVSIANCKVIGAQIPGVTVQLTDFGHGCDTLGGSSGSPAMDLGSGKVIGLHHLGFLPNNDPVNRAVRFQQIVDFLRQNLTDPTARRDLGL